VGGRGERAQCVSFRVPLGGRVGWWGAPAAQVDRAGEHAAGGGRGGEGRAGQGRELQGFLVGDKRGGKGGGGGSERAW